MSDRHSSVVLWILVACGGLLVFGVLVFVLLIYSMKSEQASDFSFGEDKVAVVDLTGEIFDSTSFVEQLDKYGKDSSIKAIVLHIDSPGGSAAASQEIYSAINRVRTKNKKIVVASIASVGASGAYYAACAADKVYANPSALTGSIGVILQYYSYGDLLKWMKMKDVVVKSGQFKDTGDPARDLTDAEKEYLQKLIDDTYQQFVEAVAKGRKLSVDAVKTVADGRVFTGREAKANKLVDEVGDLQDAIDAAAKMANIKGEPHVIKSTKQKPSLFDLIFGDASSLIPPPLQRMSKEAPLQYLWHP
ncbi:MAG: signal peptide peptidase SppA [Acidobacteriia bacterium]|nr:signal peptide peptidase SppA [Terriglobia bacterium]